MREFLATGGTRLGELLRLAREEKGISRTKLAKFVGISPNSLVKYEKAGEEDGKYPSTPNLMRLCEILEVDPRNAFDCVRAAETRHSSDEQRNDQFSFSSHFQKDLDWLNWKLSIKNIDDLNQLLEEHLGVLHFVDERLKRIEQAQMQNGPDKSDPSRSDINPDNSETAPTVSTKPKIPGAGG